MADENTIDNEEEQVSDETELETEPVANIDDMIDKIVNDDNVGAKADFETLIANKLNAHLDARKQDIAQSLYSDEQGEEVSDEQEDTATTEE